ncbi:hypothetical protein [Motilimonas eburnea]|uniref:hypothetical protein n=1 Tax=Motilimonas eburnea TaxID=1737488 RepID=UPI001E5443ED|nr:hypothetical protein [Motilimonas eburnea]MCE2571665.1 hypothetical protein [Motilimonas eburnea]
MTTTLKHARKALNNANDAYHLLVSIDDHGVTKTVNKLAEKYNEDSNTASLDPQQRYKIEMQNQKKATDHVEITVDAANNQGKGKAVREALDAEAKAKAKAKVGDNLLA